MNRKMANSPATPLTLSEELPSGISDAKPGIIPPNWNLKWVEEFIWASKRIIKKINLDINPSFT
jgi:hypothetical protein